MAALEKSRTPESLTPEQAHAMIEYASTPTGRTEISDLADRIAIANTGNEPKWLAYEGYLRVVIARGDSTRNAAKETARTIKETQTAESKAPAPAPLDLRAAMYGQPAPQPAAAPVQPELVPADPFGLRSGA